MGTRKTSCHCQVVIKLYLHTPIILGYYLAKHNYKIGSANIAYIRLSGIAQEQIKNILTQKIDHKEIVSWQGPKQSSC